MDFGGGDDIRFEWTGVAGVVTLTRPKALNALNHDMVLALSRALTAWEYDRKIALVIVKAEGRAFCAGGDIMNVYESRGMDTPPIQFFADEYRLNARIECYPKPYISLIDGIVMGGGVGISCHGSHRVMTENAMFAMPEVGIGFFPDVGGSHILPNLGGYFGIYLALTGNRIRYGDALWSGLATHTIATEGLIDLLERLCETGDVETVLLNYCMAAKRETECEILEDIARHFAKRTLGGVIESLKADAGTSEFAAKTLATILSRSPTSLAVTFRQVHAGLTMSMTDCMRMEFRILNHMLAGHDFYEGIRAVLVDKGSTPVWRPAYLHDVDPAAIDRYFEALGDRELVL